jgi:hypothetical protein
LISVFVWLTQDVCGCQGRCFAWSSCVSRLF